METEIERRKPDVCRDMIKPQTKGNVMKPDEKIYVKDFWCESVEDSYENGETGKSGSAWGDRDVRFENPTEGYATVAEALAAVCKSNCFRFNVNLWTSFFEETGEDDFGRFDSDVLVDADNSEVSRSEIEKWRKGEIPLWNCHIIVHLEVRTIREMTKDDIAEWLAPSGSDAVDAA